MTFVRPEAYYLFHGEDSENMLYAGTGSYKKDGVAGNSYKSYASPNCRLKGIKAVNMEWDAGVIACTIMCSMKMSFHNCADITGGEAKDGSSGAWD